MFVFFFAFSSPLLRNRKKFTNFSFDLIPSDLLSPLFGRSSSSASASRPGNIPNKNEEIHFLPVDGKLTKVCWQRGWQASSGNKKKKYNFPPRVFFATVYDHEPPIRTLAANHACIGFHIKKTLSPQNCTSFSPHSHRFCLSPTLNHHIFPQF